MPGASSADVGQADAAGSAPPRTRRRAHAPPRRRVGLLDGPVGVATESHEVGTRGRRATARESEFRRARVFRGPFGVLGDARRSRRPLSSRPSSACTWLRRRWSSSSAPTIASSLAMVSRCMAPPPPEVGKIPDHVGDDIGLFAVVIPVEHQAQVLEVGGEPVEAGQITRPESSGEMAAAERPVVLRVAGTHRPRRFPTRPSGRPRTGGSSPTAGTSPRRDRLRRATCRPARSRAPTRRTRRSSSSLATASAASRVKPPANTDRRSSTALSAFGQELVGPVDRGLQRLVTGHRGAAPAGEHPEPLVEPLEDLGRRDRPRPGRRQLDGERDAVEPAAELDHRRRRRRRRARTRAAPPAPASTNSSTASPSASVGSGVTGTTRSAGTPRPSRLVAITRTSGALVEIASTTVATLATRCSQLSTTNSKSSAAQPRAQPGDVILARGQLVAQRLQQGRGDPIGGVHRRQIGEPGPVGKLGLKHRRHLQSQAASCPPHRDR